MATWITEQLAAERRAELRRLATDHRPAPSPLLSRLRDGVRRWRGS